MSDKTMDLAALSRLESHLLAPVYPFPRPLLVSGRGATVTDADGIEYLDFTSGIGVNALGHAPKGLARAVSRQVREIVHASNLFGNAPAALLAVELLEATGYDRVFFCNSGTEGIEAALKFARVFSDARERNARLVTAFTGGFHGRTAFALSTTWNPAYREPFLPLVPGVHFAPYNAIEGLDAAITAETTAVIVEPIQGESGAVPADREFLEAIRSRATEVGATLIFDEVQSGMGRSGRLLAAEVYGVEADITVLSKALGGGIPFAAVLVRKDLAATLKPGMHGSTFGGGPVGAAAARYVLGRVNRPEFLARVRRRAERLHAGLERIVSKSPLLESTRGLGLLRAALVAKDSPCDASTLIRAAAAERLLLVKGGDRGLRFLPPLNVTKEEIGEALRRFEAALRRAAREAQPVEENTTPTLARGEER